LFEASHFLGSIVGVLLLLLARGLARRLDGAFFGTVALLAIGALVLALRGVILPGAALLAVLLVLVRFRGQFSRPAALSSEPFGVAWTVACAVALTATVGLAFLLHRHVEYQHTLWWKFALDGDAPRSMRALVGALAVATTFAAARLFGP